ncbi:MAG TPA: exodeoxyribonuclease III [Planctomycetota bacterium]|nr:exodeoxyribonuclease III [Planctomycetota bacterium]
MIIASWNVNGLRAIAKKDDFAAWLSEADPDVLLLQETKAQHAALPIELEKPEHWFTRYQSAIKKGYSGTAVWSRYEPDAWIDGIGDPRFDDEGRVVGARFGDLVVLSTYFPNSQDGGKRLDYKLAFDEALERFVLELRDAGRHVLIGGDFNVAHEEIDLATPKENVRSAGFLPEERAWFGNFLQKGFVDSWRRQHPGVADIYTWWAMRTRARERNIGWRIDYFVCDEEFWPRVRSTTITPEVQGSDHCPVSVQIDPPK